MKRLLTIALLLVLAGCDGGADDRLLGTRVPARDTAGQVTTFHDDGSVQHVTAAGDTMAGYYTFVNRNSIKLDLTMDGDSLAFLWQLDFAGDSLVVTRPNDEQVVLRRTEE